jgi:hypothetical protein
MSAPVSRATPGKLLKLIFQLRYRLFYRSRFGDRAAVAEAVWPLSPGGITVWPVLAQMQ